MYAAWKRVSGDVESWSSRFSMIGPEGGDVDVDEVVQEDEELSRERQERDEFEEHELALLAGELE